MADGGRRTAVVAVVGLRVPSLEVEEAVFSGLDVQLDATGGSAVGQGD